MRNALILINALALMLASCAGSTEENVQKVRLTNDTDVDREDVVVIDLNHSDVNQVLKGDVELVSEFVDVDGDGKSDKALVLVDVAAGQSVELALKSVAEPKKFEKLTQAELSIKQGGEWTEEEYVGGEFVNLDFLRVPDQHTDHTYFIRYEGPGWESDKMGYRFYLDWRNGMDVFGKMTSEVVLQGVGQDGFDSYHELSDWGMDLLKVGKTLGVGSIGQFRNDTLFRFKEVDSVTCQITENGLLKSEIETKYYGWSDGGVSTDLTSLINIKAGSGLTGHRLKFSTPLEGFCTGLVTNEGEQFVDEVVGGYRILATYGNFSLNKDQMGLAVIVPVSAVKDVVDGAGSHVVLFNAAKEVEYYFVAVWEKGVNPVKTMDEFQSILRKEAKSLNQPFQIASVK